MRNTEEAREIRFVFMASTQEIDHTVSISGTKALQTAMLNVFRNPHRFEIILTASQDEGDRKTNAPQRSYCFGPFDPIPAGTCDGVGTLRRHRDLSGFTVQPSQRRSHPNRLVVQLGRGPKWARPPPRPTQHLQGYIVCEKPHSQICSDTTITEKNIDFEPTYIYSIFIIF